MPPTKATRLAMGSMSPGSPSNSKASQPIAATTWKLSRPPSSRSSVKKRFAMPDATDPSSPDFADDFFSSLQRGNLRYFPVVPGKVEFAAAVRRELRKSRPQIVALELPVTLEKAYRKAVDRLPAMSVIFYSDPGQEDIAVYVPVEPADPFIEAIRTAREIDAQIVFLDPDAGERPHLGELPGYLRASFHHARSIRLLVPFASADPLGRNRTARGWDRLEVAGLRSAGQRIRRYLPKPARPGARRHGAAAGATHFASARGIASPQSASRVAGRDHHGLPAPPRALRNFRVPQ